MSVFYLCEKHSTCYEWRQVMQTCLFFVVMLRPYLCFSNLPNISARILMDLIIHYTSHTGEYILRTIWYYVFVLIWFIKLYANDTQWYLNCVTAEIWTNSGKHETLAGRLSTHKTHQKPNHLLLTPSAMKTHSLVAQDPRALTIVAYMFVTHHTHTSK